MPRPDISIIIVNWKVRDLLDQCLASIFAYQKNYILEIFVVDNASGDGSVEMVRKKYPTVNLIPLEKNIGFGPANNLALKKSTADYIFLLNPDTEITAGFFDIILDYAKNHPQLAVVGPRIINQDGSQQDSIRRFPDLLSQILILLKLKNVLHNNILLNRYLCKDFDYSQEQSVDQIMGAAMFIKREVFDKIGLFDEKFFIWFEEVDLCKRIIKAGLEIKYFPQAKIIHWGGKSFSKNHLIKKQIIFNRSLLYYFIKHKALWQTVIILCLWPLNIILTLVYALFSNKEK